MSSLPVSEQQAWMQINFASFLHSSNYILVMLINRYVQARRKGEFTREDYLEAFRSNATIFDKDKLFQVDALEYTPSSIRFNVFRPS
jgi:hypothetical protein